MSLLRQTLILVALISVGFACDGSTGPRPEPRAETSVLVRDDTLVATMMSNERMTWMEFTIPITIHNEGPAAVRLFSCGSGIEAETADSWQRIYTPICALELVVPEEIAPGQTREFDMPVHAGLAGPAAPRWEAGSIDGNYRVAIALLPVGAEGVIPLVTSNPFALVVEP